MEHIVIADDDRQIRTLVRTILGLTPSRYEVHEATDGTSALTMIRTVRPRLAVLDVEMPGATGVEVCRSVKTDADLADTAIAILTGLDTPASRASAGAAGADAYLTKPVSPSQMLATVEALLTVR